MISKEGINSARLMNGVIKRKEIKAVYSVA